MLENDMRMQKFYLHFLLFFEQLLHVETPSQTPMLGL